LTVVLLGFGTSPNRASVQCRLVPALYLSDQTSNGYPVHQTRASLLAKAAVAMAVMASCIVTGCARDRNAQNLNAIYNSLAEAPDYERNPVIVIPGILGTRLVDPDSGREVWGTIDSSRTNPNDPEIASLLALPMEEGKRLVELRDRVIPTEPLHQLNVKLLGIPIQFSAYDEILNTLSVGGYRDESSSNDVNHGDDHGDDHFTCFQFTYDWRRDIAESAILLHEHILKKKAFSEAQYQERFGIENPDIQFDIVAHSMGCLVLRYYLRYGPQPLPEDGSLPELTWAGAKYVNRAILIAPPNNGSVLSMCEMLAGSKFSSFLPVYPPAVLGTMPSIYQLCPRPGCGSVVRADDPSQQLDIADPQVWEDLQWSITSPDQDRLLQAMLPDAADRETRVRIANEHRRKCIIRAAQLNASLDFPATPPPGLQLHLFAGSSESTVDQISVDMKTGEFEKTRFAAGDGTVTRNSAIMVKEVPGKQPVARIYPIAWSSKTFIPSDHLGLTKHPIFVDNVLSLLLESRHRGSSPAIRSAQVPRSSGATVPLGSHRQRRPCSGASTCRVCSPDGRSVAHEAPLFAPAGAGVTTADRVRRRRGARAPDTSRFDAVAGGPR